MKQKESYQCHRTRHTKHILSDSCTITIKHILSIYTFYLKPLLYLQIPFFYSIVKIVIFLKKRRLKQIGKRDRRGGCPRLWGPARSPLDRARRPLHADSLRWASPALVVEVDAQTWNRARRRALLMGIVRNYRCRQNHVQILKKIVLLSAIHWP